MTIEPSAAIVRYVKEHPGATSQQIADALLGDTSIKLSPAATSISLIYRINALCANGFIRGESARDRQHHFYPIDAQ